MPKIKQSLAIIVGINQYEHIPILKNAVADAVGLAGVLKDTYGYEVLLLLNQRATKAELDRLIKSLQCRTITFDDKSLRVTKSDRVLFYFAGHGFAQEAQDSEVGKPAGYFMPQDASDNNKSTWLSMQEVYEAFSALNCHHLLMILDCCFAGRISWISQGRNIARSGKLYRQSYDRFIKHKTEQIITSAAHDEEAQDLLRFGRRREKNGNSPFAHLLLKVLSGNFDSAKDKFIEAIVEDGVITTQELFAYLQNKLGAIAAGQTPGLSQPRKYDPKTREYVYLKGEYIFPLPKFNPDSLPKYKLNKNTNPYKGLASFDIEDNHLFFGRTVLSQQLADVVKEQPLTVVLGVSGSGKSSLAKAGLIPTLKAESKEQHWQILDPMRPGGSPFKELNKILTQSKSGSSIVNLSLPEKIEVLCRRFSYRAKGNLRSKLLLVIDQSEELLTLSRNPQEAKDFLTLLAKLLNKYSQLRIVLTLRSDFESQIKDTLDEPNWQQAWQKGRFIVSPMNREELQQVIEQPAVQRTLFFESPRLVNQLIDETIDRTGILPLLSFTLSELYLKYLEAEENGEKSDRTISEADYLELGGVEGSLAQAATRTYRELRSQKIDSTTINNVMLRMVALNGSEITRRRVLKSELNYPEPINEKVETIINCFVEARLLTTGKDVENLEYVEPVHDALVKRWQKLIFKPETHENLLLQRRLTPAAEKWDSFYREKSSSDVKDKTEVVIDSASSISYTFTLKNLITKIKSKFIRQLERSPNDSNLPREKPERFLWNASPYLNVLNKEVLHSAKNNWLNEVETRFVQSSVKRRRRNSQARWVIALSAILGLSILSITTLFGRRDAQISQIQALIESSDARFNSEQEFDALLDSLRAAKTFDELNKNVLLTKLLPKNQALIETQLSQILQQAVYGVTEYNRLESDANPENEGGIVEWSRNLISWSPDNKTLAFATKNNTVKLWQPDGDLAPTIIEDKSDTEAPIIGVSWSKKGILATVRQDGTVNLWNRDGKRTKSFEVKPKQNDRSYGKIYGVSWSPDGEFLTFPTQSGYIVFLLWKDGSLTSRKVDSITATFALSWSPDGILASAGAGRTVELWNPSKFLSNSVEITDTGISGWVTDVSWSYDGNILASASDDNNKVTLHKVSQKNGEVTPYKILEHSGNVSSLSWSKNGILASGTKEGTIRLWNSDSTLLDTFQARGLVQSLSWSPNGQILAAISQDGTVQVWKLNSLLTTLADHNEAVNTVSWSPDAKILASGSDDETIKLWHEDGTLYKTFKSNLHFVNNVSWSPDGRILAFVGATKDKVQLWIWNNKKFYQSETLDHSQNRKRDYSNPVKQLSWSPDGKFLASASSDTTLQVWDRNGDWQKTLYHDDWVYDVSWGQNGLLVSAGKDGSINIWNKNKPDGEPLYTFDNNNLNSESELALSVDWNTDKQILASAHQDYTIRLWGDKESELLDKQKGQEREVLDLNWSPNSKILASASKDGTVNLWKLDNTTKKTKLTPITTLKGHESSVNEVSWSPDSKSLATASSDTTVKLWRLGVVDLENEEQFFQDLLVQGCNWMRPYLKYNPNVNESDRTLCDFVSPAKE